MFFRYGNYTHPFGECLVTNYSATRLVNRMGVNEILRRRMTIVGDIIADGQANINERVRQLKEYYAVQAADAALLDADGKPTHLVLPSLGSLTGVRVVDGPNFLQAEGQAHFATGLPFNITLECDYLEDGSSATLSEYQETITVTGTGGPRRITFELDSGLPIEQITSTNTPVTVSQQGFAVGVLSWPPANDPWAPSQINLPDGFAIERTTGTFHGQLWTDYRTSWRYHMTFTSWPGIAFPALRAFVGSLR